MKKLFDNIGGKIKLIAKIIFAIIALAGVITGVYMFCDHIDSPYGSGMVAVGVLITILRPVVAWAISCSLYGFGQLIENSDKIVAKLDK